jgi:hypothetical protein
MSESPSAKMGLFLFPRKGLNRRTNAMNDDPTLVPDDGSAAQSESSQTTPEVTQAVTTPPAVSLTEIERLLEQRDAKWSATLETERKKWQSKSDTAYAKALADAKVIEQNAEMLGLDADAVSEAKRKLIDRKFTDAFAEEPTPAPTIAPPYQPAAAVIPISQRDVKVQLEHDGFDVFDIGKPKVEALIEKFKGRPQGDPQVISEWNAEMAQIRQDLTQQRQQQAQAQTAAQNAAAYGGAKPLGSGSAAAGYDPVKKLEESNNQDPPENPVELKRWLANRAQWKREAEAKGW